jgi:hypothetical protein
VNGDQQPRSIEKKIGQTSKEMYERFVEHEFSKFPDSITFDECDLVNEIIIKEFRQNNIKNVDVLNINSVC